MNESQLEPREMVESPESNAEMRRPPAPVDWTAVRRVHLMGICGSAMGAFAQMLAAAGYDVRGSDAGAYPPMSDQLRAAGITIAEGYRADNLRWDPDVVIVGNVIRPTCPEAIALRRRGIAHCSLPQALGALFLQGRRSVVITGTHGKTTTSSMTAWLMDVAGLRPGFMIGGVTGNFQASSRLPTADTFVVEGDEYDTAYFDKGPKFLHYAPRLAAINNIEFDHADIFEDLAAIEDVFRQFARLLPEDGRLITRSADALAMAVSTESKAPVWTIGMRGSGADIIASECVDTATGAAFTLHLPGCPRVPTKIALSGQHNIENALVAAGLTFAAGATAETIARGLASYRPPLKRQQLKGVALGTPVYDDFAHHPTAIKVTLAAMAKRHPGRRLLALFEVQSNTARRRVFQAGFADALALADRVWFCAPLEKKGDTLAADERLDLGQLAEDLCGRGTPASVIVDIDALATAVAASVIPGEAIIVAMSGRDFHGIHDRILQRLNARRAD